MVHLNPQQLRVLNWNLQKQSSPLLQQELAVLKQESDLAALQEAVLEPVFLDPLRADTAFSFTPGYRTLSKLTGVLTMTRMPALSSMEHLSLEPWLRTPKAIHLTHHHLDGHDQSLLVINLHAVNFTLGDKAYRQQLNHLLPSLQNHNGPVVLTGDFNTWNPIRRRCLKELVQLCGLTEVRFDEDHRKKILQHPLDHMFIRGLDIVSASTRKTLTSDHNPLLATFAVPG
jgi:endonuclease/exonuclease/phosphatase (EEP) superfamily protein YafD